VIKKMNDIVKNDELYNSNMNGSSEPKKDLKPLIAGVLLIIAGLMSILTWIAVFSIDYSMIDISILETQNMTITTEQLQSIMSICATIGIILSIFPLLGGILSIQKKLWGGALAGSIIGLFTVGPIFLSSILSLISLILLIITRNQFQQQTISIDDY
jgi:hypothetical protein